MIEVRELYKNYEDVSAINGISFSVNEGDLFAFLGTNGAGKSTTIDILCTLLKSDQGQVLVAGEEVGKNDDHIRSQIGVVFQHSVLDDLLTVKENLCVRASFYGITGQNLKKRLNHLSEICQLESFLNRPYGKLSGGQKRRTDIARALINIPKILFLDEPTTGLDPSTRKSIWDAMMYMQKDYGMTVFLTTHYMEEAKHADYVTIIDKGSIIEQGTPAHFKSKYTKSYLKVYSPNQEIEQIFKKYGVNYEVQNDILVTATDELDLVLDLLKRMQPFMSSFEYVKGSIDDAFIHLAKGR